ncbi:MAG: F0F1 ATP synthase subunit B [Bacillota bacterium]|nr:F0F1 ATP synthase subunit B [Bacillota bacterium]
MLRLDYNLLFTMINLLILYFLMKKFLFGPVNAILKKRKDLVDQKFADANLTEENALKMKDEYEAALKSAKSVSEQIVEDAKVRAKTEHDRIIKETEAEAGKILGRAQQNIELERNKTMRNMEAEIVGLAIAAAAKIVGQKSTAEDNQKLYDQFLKEVGEKSKPESNEKPYGKSFTEAGELNESNIN